MYTFKDSVQREWLIDLNTAVIIRVHKETGFDMHTLRDRDDESPLEACFEFIANPIAFGPVLCAVIKDQLEKKQVSQEAFLESLDGTAAEAAGLAFVRGYTDFFHSATKKAMHKIVDTALSARMTGTELAMKKLDELDLEKVLAERIAKSSGTTYGNAPASSDLTQDHSLSASL